MTILASIIMKYTLVGRRIYSIGGDEKVAASSELVKSVVDVLGSGRRSSKKSNR